MVKERKQTPRDHAGRFKRLEAPRNALDHLVRLLVPNDRPETLVALFEGRASYHTIRDWRRGRRGTPRWAAELLGHKASILTVIASQIKTGPGKGAGYRNLGSWRASRNSER